MECRRIPCLSDESRGFLFHYGGFNEQIFFSSTFRIQPVFQTARIRTNSRAIPHAPH